MDPIRSIRILAISEGSESEIKKLPIQTTDEKTNNQKHHSPSKLDWLTVTADLLKDFLDPADQLAVASSSNLLQNKTALADQNPDLILWLEDRPECFSRRQQEFLAGNFPLANQVVMTGPWGAGSGVAGSGKSGRRFQNIPYINWIQFPYLWLAFRQQWNQFEKTIWDQPPTSSEKLFFNGLVANSSTPNAISFLVAGSEGVYLEEIEQTLNQLFPENAMIQKLILSNSVSEKERSKKLKSAFSTWLEENKTNIEQKIFISDLNPVEDVALDSLIKNWPTGWKSIAITPFADSQISVERWAESWKNQSHLLVGKPFHQLELQSAITYLCF